MSIPNFQTIMLPLLQFTADGQEHSLRETIDALADQFDLIPDERRALLPSGRQAAFDNRVGWARTYLKKAGLLEYTRRGYYRITDRGQQVLAQHPTAIDIDFLRGYKEFRDFQKPRAGAQADVSVDVEDTETPEEQIEAAYQQIRQGLADELLQTLKGCSPAFFERLVVDLLVKMGYGGTRKDAGQAIGGTGDGGIDGIIKEDRL
ncbi:MAG: restriction endonuclease, partial [Anaerolineae bacterium]|nr:restriction endonuclease [Anaerolineae bacterium]